jgi:hypothetical protein
VRRSRLVLAALAAPLLAACQPAAGSTPAPSPGHEVRGFVVSKSAHGAGLVVRQVNTTERVLINDKTAWQRCALQEFYPTCKESR